MRAKVAFLLLSAIATACVLAYGDERETNVGTAVLRWTFDGRSDPGACDARGTPFVHFVLRDAKGRVLMEERHACVALSHWFVLAGGAYAVALTPEDGAGRPRAPTGYGSFTVVEDETVYATLDFSSATSDTPE